MFGLFRLKPRLALSLLLLASVAVTLAAQLGEPSKPVGKTTVLQQPAPKKPDPKQPAGEAVAGSQTAEKATDTVPRNGMQKPGVPAVTSEGGDTLTPTNEPNNDDKNAPYRYKPSEEISEDLSVSFPVDI